MTAMESEQATGPSAYEEYVALHRQLVVLIADGKDDGDLTPETDALRDRMDAPWYAMTEEERRKINDI